jgi:hypothetical protein
MPATAVLVESCVLRNMAKPQPNSALNLEIIQTLFRLVCLKDQHFSAHVWI